MNDLQLRYFLVCAEELSFTRAADRLGISQPALSQQIKRLEASLKITLFYREGRGIKLTASGNKLWQRVLPLFENLDQVIQETKFQEGVSEGTIAIAGVHSILPYMLSGVISDYAQQCADVNFRIYTRSSQEVIQLVHNRTADFGLVYQNLPMPPEIEVAHLLKEKLVVAYSPQLAAADEIERTGQIPPELPVILLSPGYALRKVVNQALRNTELNISFEVETLDMMINLCANNAGICFAPEYVVSQRADLNYCKLADIKMELSMAIITRYGKSMQPIAEQLIENIKAYCQHP